MNRVRPLGFADGLQLGGVSMVAGLSLVIVLVARRWWVALLVGVAAPALVGGATGPLGGSGWELVQTLGFIGLPIVVIGLLVVLSRVELGWVGIGVAAWWPGFFHLLLYLRWMALPEGFRDGVGIMWVGSGLLVGAVARGWGNRLPKSWNR